MAPNPRRTLATLTGASLVLSSGVPGSTLTPTARPATTQSATAQVLPSPTPLGVLQALRTLSEPATVELDLSDATFSQAVARLERCRTAQAQAERRAARGELSRRALEVFRDETAKAQSLVEKLQELRAARQQAVGGVTIVVDGGGVNTYVPVAAMPTPRPTAVRQPNSAVSTTSRVARVTAPRVNVTVLVTPSPQGSGAALSENPPLEAPRIERTTTARPLLAAAPLMTRSFVQRSEGSISTPAFGNRSMLALPHKAGMQAAPLALASLPPLVPAKPAPPLLSNGAVPAAVSPVVPSVAVPAVAVVPKPAPVKPPLNTQSDTRARLAQLAQLEAQLNHAEKRLNAADAALSVGQRQLAKFAGTLRQAMLEAGPDATGLHPFVKIAEKYAGTPYVWGGESRGGFDCSGLIILVMRELGYRTPPHSAAEQFKYGTPIAQPLLKPGDLVFFANTYKPGISHVGIYLGKRRFIHAAGTGKGTIVSSLDASKYQEKYAGGRRLVQAR